MSVKLIIRNEKLKVLACLLISLLMGCERRDITYYLESELYIRADWDACALPQEEASHGATTVVFTPAGIDNKQVLMGVRDAEVFRMPQGSYSAIIFNRSPDGFTSINFTGDSFETYTAAARGVETRTDPVTRATTRVIVTTPEELAADVVTRFSVTEGMLGNYSEGSAMNRNNRTANGSTRAEEADPERYTLRFTPRKLTRKVRMEIHFEGINNIRSTVGTIDGVSESILLSTAQPSPFTAVQQFVLSEITYDKDSPFNGVLAGEFNVLGFDLGKQHTIALKILLVDNKTVVKQTLQGIAREMDDGTGQMVIAIVVSSPEKLPDVKPEGDGDSGFDAEVDDWGEPEEEEIPLD